MQNNKLLDTTLSKIRNLDRRSCLEVGIGNGLKSLNNAKLFKTYYAIEPNDNAYKECLNNIKKYDSKIKLFHKNYDNFMQENMQNKFDYILFINSFHFMEMKSVLDYIKNSYIIIVLPKFDSDNYMDDRLNRNSSIFDINSWERNKQRLADCEMFIYDNMKVYYTNMNKFFKIYISRRSSIIS